MDAVPVRGRPRERTRIGTDWVLRDGFWSMVFALTRSQDLR